MEKLSQYVIRERKKKHEVSEFYEWHDAKNDKETFEKAIGNY